MQVTEVEDVEGRHGVRIMCPKITFLIKHKRCRTNRRSSTKFGLILLQDVDIQTLNKILSYIVGQS